MSKDFQIQPHRLLSLKRELIDDGALDPGWLCHCFDHAVMWFGHWVEGKLMERDKDTHESIYTLSELLDVPASGDDRERTAIPAFGILDLRNVGNK